MGGTTADVGLIAAATLGPRSRERSVGGLPDRALPMRRHPHDRRRRRLDRLARPGGVLRVGPAERRCRSGPGLLRPRRHRADGHRREPRARPARRPIASGGGVELDRASGAERALERTIDPAAAVVEIVNAEMVRALRVVSVERGHDPREFALVAFGGAGPLHAGALAEELGIARVLVPALAGVLSALGLAGSDDRRDVVRSRRCPLEEAGELPGRGRGRRPLPRAVVRARRAARPGVVRSFHAAHEQRYGYRLPEAVELVALRLRRRSARSPRLSPRAADALPSRGDSGPAIVAFPGATCVVRPGWAGSVTPPGPWCSNDDHPIALSVFVAPCAASPRRWVPFSSAQPLLEHQGTPRLLTARCSTARADGRAGRAHPRAPGRDAGGGGGGDRRARGRATSS